MSYYSIVLLFSEMSFMHQSEYSTIPRKTKSKWKGNIQKAKLNGGLPNDEKALNRTWKKAKGGKRRLIIYKT